MIRNSIYLDSQKLRSISSQLFEGVTEQIVRQDAASDTTETSQKGPLNSGRLVADIFAKESSSAELKFLEDHAYTLLENRLIEAGSVDEYDSSSDNPKPSKHFVKITGTLSMNDNAASATTLRDFNKISEAQWRATNEASNATKQLGETEAKKKAAEAGLQVNGRWAEAVSRLLEFGYSGLLEFHIQSGSTLFSAPIKRDFLRESEHMMLHKYSRVTQMPFTILGIVTQRYDGEAVSTEIPEVGSADGIKMAMRTLSPHMRTLEQTFAGPAKGEVILDPVAVYSTI